MGIVNSGRARMNPVVRKLRRAQSNNDSKSIREVSARMSDRKD